MTTDQKNICNGKVKTRHKEGYNVFSEEACENLPTSKETYLVCTLFIDIWFLHKLNNNIFELQNMINFMNNILFLRLSYSDSF